MDLAQTLKQLRLSKSMSQEDLAMQANVSRSYISKLERGKIGRDVSIARITRIANVLRDNNNTLLKAAGLSKLSVKLFEEPDKSTQNDLLYTIQFNEDKSVEAVAMIKKVMTSVQILPEEDLRFLLVFLRYLQKKL